ncbi:hypothetical protein V2G26_001297 [Clonostachys chloroleuca]
MVFWAWRLSWYDLEMGSVTLATTVDRRIPVTSWLSPARPTDVMLSTTTATPARWCWSEEVVACQPPANRDRFWIVSADAHLGIKRSYTTNPARETTHKDA